MLKQNNKGLLKLQINMKTAVPKYTYLNPLFVIDICKLNVEEKCKL